MHRLCEECSAIVCRLEGWTLDTGKFVMVGMEGARELRNSHRVDIKTPQSAFSSESQHHGHFET